MATMNSHEQLYEKLNNVHASLRKEKEDAYRTKQLAEQRLQLSRQDREAAALAKRQRKAREALKARRAGAKASAANTPAAPPTIAPTRVATTARLQAIRWLPK